jgi:hypothetical protein
MTLAGNNASLDVFAEINPAFCTLVLCTHVSGYRLAANKAMPITLLPLVLPILMSGDLEETFSHTSEETGLSRWVTKNPGIFFSLPARIEACRELTRASLQFALHYQALTIENLDQVRDSNSAGAAQLKRIGFGQISKNAIRLGSWFGLTQSDKLIYNTLGIEV